MEQQAFLDASCAGYDAGMYIEAKRLAVTLRVLLHDTAASHSLLGQMGVKEELAWVAHEGSVGMYFGVSPEDEAEVEDELVTLNPIIVSVRTIADEVRLSLANQQPLLRPSDPGT